MRRAISLLLLTLFTLIYSITLPALSSSLESSIDSSTAATELSGVTSTKSKSEQCSNSTLENSFLEKTSFKHNVHSPSEMNLKFKDPNLKIAEFIQRFEASDREVYMARKEILEALKIKEGSRVADIGAGTGIFTELLANAVGRQGWLYAVDISPQFLTHINDICASRKIGNVSCVLNQDNSICLPPNSIDLALVVNTYHHFNQSKPVIDSIRLALSPQGKLVIIDFERVTGKSREWIIKHIHKNSSSVVKEIEEQDFKLVEKIQLKKLRENYFLIFQKNGAKNEQ